MVSMFPLPPLDVLDVAPEPGELCVQPAAHDMATLSNENFKEHSTHALLVCANCLPLAC